MKKANKHSLYSIDTFIETVKEMPKYRNVSNVTFAGFYNHMKSEDLLYVYDPQDYVKALDNYIKK